MTAMGSMVPAQGAPSEKPPSGVGAEFAIMLKGWRSQLRWAMTQREEDPARVWLEVISIDERLKRAFLDHKDVPEHLTELGKLRTRLDESMASLAEDLGDEKVAPLYAWLDLVRQKRRLTAKVEEARAAVTQARALRPPDGSKPPTSEEEVAEQLAHAQGELAQWKGATPPAPPPEIVAAWEAQGGEALLERMSRDAMAVGRRGDEARRVLEPAKGRTPGQHPWKGSRAELVSIPVAGGATLLLTLFAIASGSIGLGALAGLAFGGLAALLAYSFFARQQERAELAAAIDWVWHSRMYEERTRYAELEAGWLRALLDAQRASRSFDLGPATGAQLRDFESERPDLSEIVLEVVRDTERGGA
jgi:hypothetical protein